MTAEQILTWAIAIMMAGIMGAIGHLYYAQGQVQKKLEASVNQQFKDIRDQIRTLTAELSGDRKAFYTEQLALAKTMGTLATREDLRNEISRAFTQHRQGTVR